MENLNSFLILLLIVISNVVNGQSNVVSGSNYRIPKPTATVLTPRGFRISIPGKKKSFIYVIRSTFYE